MSAPPCLFCARAEPHPQWVVLLSDARVPPSALGESGLVSAWDFTRQPAWTLRCHNRERRFRLGPKGTKAGAPHHRNTLVLGPFRRHAAVFLRVLARKSRRLANRVARGLALAARWHEVDPAQGGQRVRAFCPGEDERDPCYRAFAGALTALSTPPPDVSALLDAAHAALDPMEED